AKEVPVSPPSGAAGDGESSSATESPRPLSHPTAGSAAAVAPAPATPVIAHGQELRALPLLWKVFTSWLAGLFGRRR
ncbi:MAG TPA: hypothetical protein VFV33_04020, partial [Gemmatimonadaceae bacterium]|nr:hypothetical protein [Gemmatimonadaceae bacterium]